MPRKAGVVKPAEIRVNAADTVDVGAVTKLEDMVGRMVELQPISQHRSDVARVVRLVAVTATEMTVLGRSHRYAYIETLPRIGHRGCPWSGVRVVADLSAKVEESEAPPAAVVAPKPAVTAPKAAPVAKAPAPAPKAPPVAAPAPAATKAAKAPVQQQTKPVPVAVAEPEVDDDEAGTATVDLDESGADTGEFDSPAEPEDDGDNAADDDDDSVDPDDDGFSPDSPED